ncbi:A/G-specific adenine glycosylase [Psychromicrobium xiongbiense]|uniref:A/G-specific adenine glycosylase n=1 Tax=Psychromicrobium xiongbiense TaxID=3051184 RepID=UPI00255549D2|nr:A/G-specific adenine glycosylase [Psychromicrobium sp. YIM S02556]
MNGSPPTQLVPDRLGAAHRAIPQWFANQARDLPWRSAQRTAWGVLLSEVMLQQTPVVRVLPIWHEWMARWPSPTALAGAPTSEVLRGWGRLGYPRRALRLQAAAQAIRDQHDGEVPRTEEELLTLPGIGSYTAAAVAAFAFGARTVVVDTNIRRVQARLFSGQALPARSLNAAETALAAAVLPDAAEESVRWNLSVMELGALICTARSPLCDQCPVRQECAWIAAGRPEPTYQPKGQAWAGTDRQMRGAVMAVLRAAEHPLPLEALLERISPVDGVERPASDPLAAALRTLHALEADPERLEGIVAGLVADGLAHRAAQGLTLPH